MSPELIVALDVPAASHVPAVLNGLGESVAFFKVGLELFVADGPGALEPLRERNKRVFLDLKLHDIPRTVARSVAAAARHGVELMTVHAGGGREMLRAAAEAAAAAGPRAPKLVAVTALTSLDQSDLASLGVARPLADHALALGEMAIACGIHGLVCSAWEAAAFRRRIGPRPILVTPGIRPAGGAAGDQKRVATPAVAVHAGATFLVVGRPILDAADPHLAVRSILNEMAAAARARPDAGSEP